jgi:hypothetical protein
MIFINVSISFRRLVLKPRALKGCWLSLACPSIQIFLEGGEVLHNELNACVNYTFQCYILMKCMAYTDVTIL